MMMLPPDRFVADITALHRETVDRWHREPVDNPYHGLLGLICQQHQFNFLLWHEEDIARSADVGDARIAEVKRAIDRYNQQRNDGIEQVDDFLLERVRLSGVTHIVGATLNTETPGSAIDRLSIMALRIFHMREQLERTDVDEEHLARVQQKLDLCLEQHGDLSHSLELLIDDIFQGRKRLKLYRQMKMYNDPTLNPALYGTRKAG